MVAERQRRGWRRPALALDIGTILLLSGVALVGDADRTAALLQTAGVWTRVLAADFLVSFSYSVFPRRPSSA